TSITKVIAWKGSCESDDPDTAKSALPVCGQPVADRTPGDDKRSAAVFHSQTFCKLKGKLNFQKNEFPLSAPEIKV
ncbi:MAG: hypothetical protein J7D99_23045, partial [Escherichia coli]|nr:hypothetical protein [Escherichia coli]